MGDDVTKQLVAQLDRVIENFHQLEQIYGGGLAKASLSEINRILTLGCASVERIAGRGSVYMKQVDRCLSSDYWDGGRLEMIIGVLKSLRADINDGYIQSVEELIHGELFSDFLEMANHLVENGYKDAAAVIACSTLEEHLRQMCKWHKISTEVTSGSKVRRKKADAMNAELAGMSAYSKLDLKNVTAWLDLRNKAAHGEYSDYTKDQVVLMIQGIRDFITRNPA